MTDRTVFDVALFQSLNEEYRDKPTVARPRTFDRASLAEEAARRARTINGRVPLGGRRVLEVGCGRGDLGPAVVEAFGCEYVGVDIVAYSEWDQLRRPGVDFAKIDIAAEDLSGLGKFDVIVSLAVLEHVVHPFAMLTAMHRLLRPGGTAYLAANLYRGPQASHRYRQVFFPWPHLLFDEPVWREWYQIHHNRDESFAWVNKLTHSQYLDHFTRVGFEARRTWLTPNRFDKAMYARFEEKLSPYPIHDLSHDFVYAILDRPAAPPVDKDARERELLTDNDRLRGEIAELRASTSWRATAPLRRATALARSLRRR